MEPTDITDTFLLHPISPAAVAEARSTGDHPNGAPVLLEAEGGEPVRCCLRDAVAGERLVLFSYRPPLPESPYVETGAVFAHAEPCSGPASVTTYPAVWRSRPQVLRAYDDRGWIHPATTTHDGSDPAASLRAVLAEPGVVEVHSRNIGYGCFMFAATRSPAEVQPEA